MVELAELAVIQLHPIILFAAGLIIMVLGAELLLRSATRMAALLGVSPIIIGLTLVSVGTTAPEMAVGLTAVAEGKGPLAVGNIAGTNMFNLLFILGLSALIRPLPIRLQSIKLDLPILIGATTALVVMALDGVLSQTEGALLLLAAVFYTLTLIRTSRQQSATTRQDFADEFDIKALMPGKQSAPRTLNMALLLAGIGLTLLGADVLVAGAVNMARAGGVSDAFIGLTVVAIGTSVPELVTTMVATYKGDRDVAVGNLVGSSIYNILVILGVALLASPKGIDVSSNQLWIDLPLAAFVALVCMPVFKSDRSVSRAEGLAFVLTYAAYLAALMWVRT
jgi:cation:H+ antiporter